MKIILAKLSGLLLTIAFSIGSQAAEETGKTPSIDKPLIACWTFDDDTFIRDEDGSSKANVEISGTVGRTAGIYGKALELHDKHALKTTGEIFPEDITKISISAWVLPVELGTYKEILRQECEQRVLFSFQNNGTILSLGLNIDGYIECDARINEYEVLDGAWHHCAATYDGTTMRVYLDGREIGKLIRPGKISTQRQTAVFIGSQGGQSEFFQGEIDDLRLYADALTADEVSSLHKGGATQAATLAKQARTSAMLEGKTFATALSELRKKTVENGGQCDPATLTKIQRAFQKECNQFREWTGTDVPAYVKSTDKEINAKLTGNIVDLLMEYRPITKDQISRQSAEDAAKWEESKKIETKYRQLAEKTDRDSLSKEWIEIIMEAGPQIQFRPYRHEPVAPYIKPETPETKSLSGDEARELMEKDWLFQANGKPDTARIQNEIQWSKALAERISKTAYSKVDMATELDELKKLEAQVNKMTGTDNNLYFKVREIKHNIMLKNPALDFDKVLFVDMPYPQGREWLHETRHRLGYMAIPGARLLVLNGLNPGGKLLQLMPQAPLHGSFWRPDVSWDGKKVLACFKPHNEKMFHLYEIYTDGSSCRQLTYGMFDDMDPIYLPDDKHIIFSTTRGHTYVRCMPPTSAFVLARCDRDGKNIYLISANNEPDYLPSVMNDGRVIYTRWEYTDKPLWRAQKLWTINPDGTQVSMYWGNQSVWPDVMKDARSIPGTRRVMFTGCGHHNWFAGSVGIIDVDKGLNFPNGITKVTTDMAWPEVGNGPTDPTASPAYHSSGTFTGYYSPYPISENDFLVSARRDNKYRLYLMDLDGNRELIYEGNHNILHAMPLKPRTKPAVIHDRVVWPTTENRSNPQAGVIFSGNVYQGSPAELRDKAKFLRVIHVDPKTYTYWYKRPYLSTGPVVSAVQSEGVKRVIGTVPIEKDGSVSFYAPPGKALHFQLLDEQQRALQTMRSFVGVMPGESRGCLGCHESHSRAPINQDSVIALKSAPKLITPLPWGNDTVSYPRYVRPTLDQYCAKCHEGKGEGRKVFDMTERPSEPVFPEPYHTIIGRPTWGKPYKIPEKMPPGFGIAGTLLVEGYGTTDPQAYVTPKPMTALSYTSPLIRKVSSGKHHGVKVDETNILKLTLWVDTMCPYLGDEELRQEDDPVFQGVEWLSVKPRIKTAPRIIRPGPVDDWKIEH